MPERYSNTRIMRRCGQLGIPYAEAIASRYFAEQGRQPPAHRVQYTDGRDGTTGWGTDKKPIETRSTTPHTLEELRALLASSPQHATTLITMVNSSIEHGLCAGEGNQTKPTPLHLDSQIVITTQGSPILSKRPQLCASPVMPERPYRKLTAAQMRTLLATQHRKRPELRAALIHELAQFRDSNAAKRLLEELTAEHTEKTSAAGTVPELGIQTTEGPDDVQDRLIGAPMTSQDVELVGGSAALSGELGPFSLSDVSADSGTQLHDRTNGALESSCTFEEHVQQRLSRLPSRDAVIWKLYVGFDNEPLTLESVGQRFGVTRERARQLRDRAWKTILQDEIFRQALELRIDTALERTHGILGVRQLAVEDDWFSGWPVSRPNVFLAILEEYRLRYKPTMWHLWRDNDITLARWEFKSWRAARKVLDTLLANLIQLKSTYTETLKAVEEAVNPMMLPEGARRRLFQLFEETARFTNCPDGEKRLVAAGTSLASETAVLLNSALHPMHMTEILDHFIEKGLIEDREYNTANMMRKMLTDAGGLVFARSVYGLPHHVPLSEQEQEDIISELRDILQSEQRARQWHSEELLTLLQERRPDTPAVLDGYMVSVLLHGADCAKWVGRQSWTTAASGSPREDRLAIADLCERELEKAGRPLSTQQLQLAVSAHRGLSAKFMPQLTARMVRLSRGMLGLIDRDIDWPAEDRANVLDCLHRILGEQQRGLHQSELVPALRRANCGSQSRVDPELLLMIAQCDGRFRVSYGALIGRSEWEGVRRMTLRAALRHIKDEFIGPWSDQQLRQLVRQLLDRDFPSQSLRPEAMKAGFNYDPQRARWIIAEPVMDVDEEG